MTETRDEHTLPGHARPFAALVLLALLALSAGGCASLPGEARWQSPELTCSYALAGAGDPTVVLVSGLGDGKASWSPVFGAIAGFTRVFAYDRVGYGASRSNAGARDGATVVEELRTTLRALDLAPPYVLVGHSLGGHFVELFARMHPAEVAGVVFVEARHVEFTERCPGSGAKRCGPPRWVRLLMPRSARAELAASSVTEQQIRGAGAFPPVPIHVLTATDVPQRDEKLQALWLTTQRELAALSPDSVHTWCDHCGHHVHRDAPELVVEAVRTVVERHRSSGASRDGAARATP